MRIDLLERKQKHLKVQKTSLLLAIIFLVLTVISALCFILFANYKIQVLMSILGSIVTSLLLMVSIGFFVSGYLYNKYLFNFYSQLESKEEQSLNKSLISVTLLVFHLEISGKDIKDEQL